MQATFHSVLPLCELAYRAKLIPSRPILMHTWLVLGYLYYFVLMPAGGLFQKIMPWEGGAKPDMGNFGSGRSGCTRSCTRVFLHRRFLRVTSLGTLNGSRELASWLGPARRISSLVSCGEKLEAYVCFSLCNF